MSKQDETRYFRLAVGPYPGNVDYIALTVNGETYVALKTGERAFCNQSAKDIRRDLERGNLYIEIKPPLSPTLVDDLAKLQAAVRSIREDYRTWAEEDKDGGLNARLNKIEADIGTLIEKARRE